MAALTDPGAVARPTCTTDRHSGADYATGKCHCLLGKHRRRRYLKLHRGGALPPYLRDATGSRRRIEGLRAQGHPLHDIAAAMGVNHAQTVHRITRLPHVTSDLAAAVLRATAILGGIPGPSQKTRDMARRAGLVPLWAWDDDIDDPAAVPQGVLPRRPAHQPMTRLTASDVTRFERYRQPAGLCARWTGSGDAEGRGKFSLHAAGRSTSVRTRRVAYWLETGRQPVGEVQVSCGHVWCCAGPHMVDSAVAQKVAA